MGSTGHPALAVLLCSSFQILHESVFLLSRSESRTKAYSAAGMRDANADMVPSDQCCIPVCTVGQLHGLGSRGRAPGSCLPEADTEHSSSEAALTAKRKPAQYLITLLNLYPASHTDSGRCCDQSRGCYQDKAPLPLRCLNRAAVK